nr:hypothetical protein [uncultured Prevotella sp.]
MKPKKKPTYTLPVAICAAVLVFGSLLLAILMATRDMAPPRKYEVDMSGTVIGVDTTSKIPVLTKEEAEEVQVKENKKVDYVPADESETGEKIPEPEPIIVPSTPPVAKEEPGVKAEERTAVPDVSVRRPDIKNPRIEPIE